MAESMAYGMNIHHPSGIAVDLDGTIYICEKNKNRILQIKYGTKSVFSGDALPGYTNGSLQEARFRSPEGLAIDLRSGALYVADVGNHAIRCIHEGRVTTVVGQSPRRQATVPKKAGHNATSSDSNSVSDSDSDSDSDSGSDSDSDRGRGPRRKPATPYNNQVTPWALAVGKQQNEVYWTTPGFNVQHYSQGKTTALGIEKKHSIPDLGQWGVPKGICSSDESDYFPVYVSYELRDDSLSSDSSSGSDSPQPRPAVPQDLTIPRGICRIGNLVYIVDHGRNVIVSFNTASRETKVVCGCGAQGYVDGELDHAAFNESTHIASDPNGNILYVSDSGNNRVRVIRLDDGKVLTLAHLGGKDSNFPVIEAELGAEGAPADAGKSYQLAGTPLSTRQRKLRKGLMRSRTIFPDHVLRIMGREYPVHKSWVLSRCPALLDADLNAAPIDDSTVQTFLDFVYSSTFKRCKDPKQLLAQAYLCIIAGFEDKCSKCLKRLSQSSTSLALDAEALLEFCNGFPGFQSGRKICETLSKGTSSSSKVTKKKIPSVFDDEPGEPAPSSSSSSSSSTPNHSLATISALSFEQAMEKLWESRSESGDFVVSLGKGSNAPLIRCHSFVLHATWPYFSQMIDANMTESQKRILTLPDPDDPDAISLDTLNLILEICYKGRGDPTTMTKFDQSNLLTLLECSGLYLSSSEPESTFSELLAYATAIVRRNITTENCTEMFLHTSQFQHLSDLEDYAKNLIVLCMPEFKKSPKMMAKIQNLPLELQVRLLWACIQ